MLSPGTLPPELLPLRLFGINVRGFP